MAGTIQVTDFPVATTLEDADIFWATRGTGIDRDKTVTALLLQKYIGDVCLKIISTGSVNLDTYFTNVVILSDPSAGITITISGALPEGKKLFIINLSTYLVNVSIETITVGLIENEYTEWISDGADMNRLWNIWNNFTKVKYLTSVDSPYTISDGETYQKYIGDTTGGDIIINLPALANNYGKEYEFLHAKQDAGDVNKMDIRRAGSDEITEDALTSIYLPMAQDRVKLLGSLLTTKWEILDEKITCGLRVQYFLGFAPPAETVIPRFQTALFDKGNLISHNHPGYNGNTEGLKIVIKKSGMYGYSHYVYDNGSAGIDMGISVNSTQLTTVIDSITPSNIYGGDRVYAINAINWGSSAGSTYLKKNDEIRPHMGANPPVTKVSSHNFHLYYLGR